MCVPLIRETYSYMDHENLTAIVLGATGLVGKNLLEKLLLDKRYLEIRVFTRRSVEIDHPRLKEFVVELFELDKYQEDFKADVVFVCIGTTKKKTPDKSAYRKVDYGIPTTAARLAGKNGSKKFLVVSSLGANANSNVFYTKTKGQMEEAVLEENIPETYIFQPSLITGDREEVRFGESFAEKLMKFVDPLLSGGWRKYRSIEAETIAEALRLVAQNGYDEKHISSDEIQDIVNKSNK